METVTYKIGDIVQLNNETIPTHYRNRPAVILKIEPAGMPDATYQGMEYSQKFRLLILRERQHEPRWYLEAPQCPFLDFEIDGVLPEDTLIRRLELEWRLEGNHADTTL